ncbi:uncharacterized protein A1O5_07759 [Cladophialophora psammophila CBS 110553]|uniref:Uncharacterized protein n=1 Tax=Cladophialophora psammophila CBS 110553 TaxID=1182543 RepID=W9WL28_9EURO|nr:uncharacterized protein A1O5_07759 [Cladophialophora psammophila CBS 110553]EXJ68827.1 hypothetical protein A1O5_07759 [Cladophialophora psammophila CBS 110553]
MPITSGMDKNTILPSFSVDLVWDTDDKDNIFHSKHPLPGPTQPKEWFCEPGHVQMSCECIDVVHGVLDPETKELATLIVLDFRFDARKLSRRIAEADVFIEFCAKEEGDNGPEVLRIAPDGNWTLLPTEATKDVDTYVNLNLPIPLYAAHAGFEAGCKRSIHQTLTSGMNVIGSCEVRDRSWLPHNCAHWTLLENPAVKSGIPVFLRSAILLKRDHMEPFRCTARVKAKVDLISSFERLFGVIGKAGNKHPISFDPRIRAGNNMRPVDMEHNLGGLNLLDLADVTSVTVFGSAHKDI